jgi:U3 small nucleolar RNA-associated protein 24
MYKIILDTNFILSSLQFKIDFFEEIKRISKFSYTLHILQGTIKELENKKLAIEIIEKKNINIIKSENTYVDKDILDLKGDYIIATNDRELIKKLKLPIIRIKQKKYLILEKI